MQVLISNAVPILFVVAFAFLVFGQLKRRKQAMLKKDIHQQSQQQAQAAGVQIASQADGRVSNSGEIHGDTNYNGTTGGIEWTLKSTVLVGESTISGGGRNQVWKRKSAWRTGAVKLPAGKFIMLMSTPGEIKMGDIKRGGFMNKLVNIAADAVLDIYVAGYFGSEYKSLVSIGEDGVKIERDQLKDFMILTNLEPAAQKYFDEATVTTIAGWKKSNVGFTEEKKVDQFGLLFSPDGVILACQSNMNNANEVKAFSDFGAALTAKMMQVLN
ncbi:MAG: hypothetical protein ABL895_08355 [Cyclobacteriaceae bacterium]